MSKRDEIANMFRVVARNAVADYRYLGYDYKGKDGDEDFLDEADDIITMLREAILSEDAVNAAAKATYQMDDEYGIASHIISARTSIPAALDAVFGEEDKDD